MIRPGLVSVTFRKLAPAEIIALVRQAQLAGSDRWALMEFVAGDDPQNFLRDAATLRSWLA